MADSFKSRLFISTLLKETQKYTLVYLLITLAFENIQYENALIFNFMYNMYLKTIKIRKYMYT